MHVQKQCDGLHVGNAGKMFVLYSSSKYWYYVSQRKEARGSVENRIQRCVDLLLCKYSLLIRMHSVYRGRVRCHHYIACVWDVDFWLIMPDT